MNTCIVEGCEKPKRRNGPMTTYCHMHYRRVMRHGDVGSPIAMRPFSYEGEKCLVVECTEKAKKKNLCVAHYDSQKSTTLSAQEIFDMKKNGCNVCGSFERLTVDHDHSCCPTNYSCHNCVRGILCHKCNTAAGLMNDNPDIMLALAAYILSNKDVLSNA